MIWYLIWLVVIVASPLAVVFYGLTGHIETAFPWVVLTMYAVIAPPREVKRLEGGF